MIDFYWIEGGHQTALARITKQNPVGGVKQFLRGVKFDVKRPVVTVTATTTDVYDFEIPGGYAVQFGNLDNPDPNLMEKVAGIKFALTEDPMVPVPLGEYSWVQLVDLFSKWQDEQFGVSTLYCRTTNGFVLDTDYPYAVGGDTEDSPGGLWNSSIVTYELDHGFKMYLMWRHVSLDVDTIPVPLSVTNWSWEFDAERVLPNAYDVDDYHTPNPPSQDTTEYPEWSSNIEDYEEEVCT